jgi:hypothetical protein
LLRNLPLLRLLKLQLLARHSNMEVGDIQKLCSSGLVKPCLLLQPHAPLFNLRGAVQRLERSVQLMVETHAHAPAGMHVVVAERL